MCGPNAPGEANGAPQNVDQRPPLREVKPAQELKFLVNVFTVEDDGLHKFPRTTFAMKYCDDYV
jgi:hypothetical protein